MADYKSIYDTEAGRYHRLVSSEDTDGNLRRALNELCAFSGRRVVEAGCGTGRLTRLLLEAGATVAASDAAAGMLEEAGAHLAEALASGRLTLQVADARELPEPSHSADVGVAGWVYGHFTGWKPDAWEAPIAAAVGELERVVRPGGDVLILETLGTGTGLGAPAPPHERLGGYYAWLEDRGYERHTLSTDYLFGSVDEAAEVLGFFFGDALVGRIREHGWARVPEWTGLWHKRLQPLDELPRE